ncbi:MAG: SRPBCC family protein [Halobacteriovoraceae bacterium]|nr:SRPBCC family protein [Halobacteriovoraceae bacterium]
MAAVTHTEIFDVDINRFYQTLIDYKSYPDFVDGCDEVIIVEQNDKSAKVQYFLNLIKKFKYTLDLKQSAPNSVTWTFDSGDIFKENNGSWELEDLGEGKTKVTYSLDVKFKVLVPKPIINKLVSSNLPKMMQQYYKRAKG